MRAEEPRRHVTADRGRRRAAGASGSAVRVRPLATRRADLGRGGSVCPESGRLNVMYSIMFTNLYSQYISRCGTQHQKRGSRGARSVHERV